MPAGVVIVVLGVVCAARAGPAQAACNLIPGTTIAFRGALATADRPFARPGDIVRLTLDPTCHAASPGLSPSAAEHVVTVVFTPPTDGPRNVVVLAADCDALVSARQACAARPEVASVSCVPAHVAAPPFDLELVGPRQLRFRFPDTDAAFREPNDDLTFSGPATLAVTRIDDPLPCALAALPCAGQAGLLACIDDLYATDGTCGVTPDATFAHFTALPPSNDYQAICTAPSPPCTGLLNEVRFTVDTSGNVLIPMEWRGILIGRDVPVARLLRGSTGLEAFEGIPGPIRIPGSGFLGSFSPEGGKLPPLFDPQSDADVTALVTLFGSADAPSTVLRVARRSPAFLACMGGRHAGLPCLGSEDCPDGTCEPSTCVGGPSAGQACGRDADCPGGECGPSLFDFRSRLVEGVGPVLLRRGACIGGSESGQACTADADCLGGQCGSFTVEALGPVPLDGLNQSRETLAFVEAEAIGDEDLNADGDTTDEVVKLADRSSGTVTPIGTGTGVGRAVARIREPPFSFPALGLDGTLVAFLEPEPAEGARDGNADGDVADTILRVFRVGPGSTTEVTGGLQLTADAAPLVNHRSVFLSDGRVFFRGSEPTRARRVTTRVSVASDGSEGQGACTLRLPVPSISADGSLVAFSTCATDLVAGDGNGPGDNGEDIFVHDRDLAATTRVSVASDGAEANSLSFQPAMSADGRHVAFGSVADDLVAGDSNDQPDVFVHDRLAGATSRVSVTPSGGQTGRPSVHPSITADGRFVAFASHATNLVAGDRNGIIDVFVHDTLTGAVTRASVASDGREAQTALFMRLVPEFVVPSISAEGRFVAFTSASPNLVPDGIDSLRFDILLHDRDTDQNGRFDEPGAIATERASIASSGEQPNSISADPSISADGRRVGFASFATNLVPGDTNGAADIFVRDRMSGATTRASASSSGAQADGPSFFPALSPDGRYVTFGSFATNLVPDDTNGIADTFVHDLLTGVTVRASIGSDGTQGDLACEDFPAAASAAEARTVAFTSCATNLVPDDRNGVPDVFVHAPDPADVGPDLSGDGDGDDTVLQAVDTATGEVVTVCPAEAVGVAGDAVAFLRPEAAGDATGCPAGPDLNGDGDVADTVVHLSRGGQAPDNLGLAATAVALSPAWLAALVSERDQGGSDLNGDHDALDQVLEVHGLAPGASWVNVELAADAVEVAGSTVVFTVPEGAQGLDLNGDGDLSDRVLQLYDAETGELLRPGQATEDFVVGTELVAFRTREAAQGGQDLNGDGDGADDVLQVYDVATRRLVNSGQAVTPCRLVACDPRVPYRVLSHTVKFLTLEEEQGEDLNGDGDPGDLVLQTLNLRLAQASGGFSTAAASTAARQTRTRAVGSRMSAGALTTLAAASLGICTDTAEACATDAGCPRGSCFVPPGGCVRDLAVDCNPQDASSCAAGQFCEPLLDEPGRATCHQVLGPCRSDADCPSGVTCRDAGQSAQRLVGPLTLQEAGAQAFTSAGRCVEDFATQCGAGTRCGPEQFCAPTGTCRQEHGTCRADGDCPAGSRCRQELIVATAGDADADEIPDPFDVCPSVANVGQEDTDGDGVGDACDLETCGNGVREGGEQCDGTAGTACAASCRPDCTCACATEVQGSVVIRTSRGALRALLIVPLAAYDGEPIDVRLDDGDSAPLVRELVSGLSARGPSRARWSYRRRGDGLRKIELRPPHPRSPGLLRLLVHARHWFEPAEATEAAATTRLTVTVGTRCFTRRATRKTG